MSYAKFMLRTIGKTFFFFSIGGVLMSPTEIGIISTLAILGFISYILGKENK